jgi:AraC-like DNA-binding protein
MNASSRDILLSRMGYVLRSEGVYAGQPHSHDDEYEFHFITEGTCRFVNGEQLLSLKERSLVFSAPGVPHATLNTPTSKHLSFFFICFTVAPRMHSVMDALQAAFLRIGFLDMGLDFASQLEQLLIKQQSPDRLLQCSAQHLFISLLYEIMRLGDAPAKAGADRYTTKLVQHMRGNIHGRLDLSSAADRLGVSKPHLIRVFKSNMGMPPLRYFNRLKMDTARDLLRRTDMTLAQIADQLSFCDEFYFSRVFKKYAGVSPNGYRHA